MAEKSPKVRRAKRWMLGSGTVALSVATVFGLEIGRSAVTGNERQSVEHVILLGVLLGLALLGAYSCLAWVLGKPRLREGLAWGAFAAVFPFLTAVISVAVGASDAFTWQLVLACYLMFLVATATVLLLEPVHMRFPKGLVGYLSVAGVFVGFLGVLAATDVASRLLLGTTPPFFILLLPVSLFAELMRRSWRIVRA